MPQLEPLTDQQIIKVCNLQHCCQQAEDALTQGMDKLQQTLAQSILNMTTGAGNYSSQMVSSMENLEALESFVNQVCVTFIILHHCQFRSLRQRSMVIQYRQRSRFIDVYNSERN